MVVSVNIYIRGVTVNKIHGLVRFRSGGQGTWFAPGFARMQTKRKILISAISLSFLNENKKKSCLHFFPQEY